MRPGIEVLTQSTSTGRGAGTRTGTWLVVGPTERGSATAPKVIRSMSEYERHFGARITQSMLYDALDVFFREGGSTAVVQRVVSIAAATSTKTLEDSGSDPSLKVDAKSPGAWGNSLSVAVTASGGDFVLTVSHSTLGTVEVSPPLADQAAAVNWSQTSEWVSVSIPAGATSLIPAVATAAALTGGTDDWAGVNDTQRVVALNYLTRDFGPGQVSAPGVTSATTRTALRAHAKANNRVALLDITDAASASTVATEGGTLQGDEHAAAFGPWIKVPGVTSGTTRTVPPVALAAGLMGRNDAGRSPNEAAAGASGRSRYATGLTQPGWTDAERETLNQAGVNVFRNIADTVTLYGYRTLAKAGTDATAWLWLGNQRLRMAITDECEQVAEAFLFQQLDGRGHKLAEFGGALGGVLKRHHDNGSLYGLTTDDAYVVDVGPSVNTPQTLTDRQLRAVIGLRMSPGAELVQIYIHKSSIDVAL